MRKLSIVSQNHLVNIVRLRAMVQDRDEPVRTYLARLKGAAGVCSLTVKCSCDPSTVVSYSDKEILHCLVNGLADKDIRNQVMGKVEVMNLEMTVKFVEAKEAGRKAGDYLDGGDATVNKVTGYRRLQREQLEHGMPQPEVVDDARCRYCNRKGHGAAPVISKKRELCPAYDKKCNTCGAIGHFSRAKACRKVAKVEKLEVVTKARRDEQCEINEKLVTVTEVQTLKHNEVMSLSLGKPLPHMMDVEGELVVAMPRDHPKLRVQVVVDVQTYKDYGMKLQLRKSCMNGGGKIINTPRMELLCDTGAQVDCINIKRLRSLGLEEKDLLRPEVSVGCANMTTADVAGVFFGKVSAMEGSKRIEVKAMFYVLKKGGDMLSRHVCERMGLISGQFPSLGEHSDVGLRVNDLP